MKIDNDFLLVITSSGIGEGEANLSAKLTDLFFKVLPESDVLPAKINFLNAGIFLTTEGSPIEANLKRLEERGVEIVSCITCLNYFGRMEKIVVGRPGDMKDTVNAVISYRKVVTF
ncbi:MAG: hypothetical protein KJ645_02835 [Planctomycetes bacterium]|nr:hypothetical protein [Planctomycetota bacterium]